MITHYERFQFPAKGCYRSVKGGVKPGHQHKAHSYLATAHHLTSRLPDPLSIAGRFSAGENTISTLNPELTFKMQAHNGRFFESAILSKHGRRLVRSEEIAFVVGSATKGQTYLYWKGDELFGLPVSYRTELNQWVNSPGFVDGSADFERPVTPRCLECHATRFEPSTDLPVNNRYNKNNFVLEISCERCHGPECILFKAAAENLPATGLNG